MLLRFGETVNRLDACGVETALPVFRVNLGQLISSRTLKNSADLQIFTNCPHSHVQMPRMLTFGAMLLSTRSAYLGYGG
jgi:hypothetical protein